MRTATLVMALMASMGWSQPCPAEAQPEWSSASAGRKRELVRACHPDSAEPAAQAPAPSGAARPRRSRAAQRATQLVLGTLLAAGSGVGVFVAIGTGHPAAYAGGIGGSLLVGPLVLLLGEDVSSASVGLTLLGALLGTVASAGVVSVGMLLGSVGTTGEARGWNTLFGALLGLAVSFPLPALGAVLGFDGGAPSRPFPQVTLTPLPGGAVVALGASF